MSCFPHGGCLTCGDVGIEMRVVAADGTDGFAVCDDDAGVRREVETTLVGAVAPGDRVLVHADVALIRLGTP
jgi:hydrogenase maturation factor